MAKRKLGKSFKLCATCARWSGQRQVNATRDMVEFETDQMGECVKGGFDRRKMSASNTCSKHQSWL